MFASKLQQLRQVAPRCGRSLVVWFALLTLLLPALAASEDVSRGAEVLGPTEYLQPSGAKLTLYRRSIAVVIGIDAYPNLPPLGGAKRDARNVAAYLRSVGFEVRLLLDEQATRSAITALVGDELPGILQPDDRVVIYFAGHGLSRGQDAEAMGYLMPFDGRREHPASTGISMAELQRWFSSYPARHVLYLADACYSGLAIGTRAVGLPPGTRDYVSEVIKRPVRVALVAGAAGQEAHEYRGAGLFTGFVLEGLRGAADANRDGLVTTDELVTFVKPNVVRVAASELHSAQLPQLGRSGEGEFLFVTPRPSRDPVPERLPGSGPQPPQVEGAPLPETPTAEHASVHVTCQAPHSSAVIDGVSRTSPASFSVDPGPYVVRCTASGYLLAFSAIEAIAGRSLDVTLPMRSSAPRGPEFDDHGDLRLGWSYALQPRASLAASSGLSNAKVSYTSHNSNDAIHPTSTSSSSESVAFDSGRAPINPQGFELRWVSGAPHLAFSAAFGMAFARDVAVPVTVHGSGSYVPSVGSSDYELGDLYAGTRGTITSASDMHMSLDLLGRWSWRRLRFFGGAGVQLARLSYDVDFKIGSVANHLSLTDAALGVPAYAGVDVLLSESFLLCGQYRYDVIGDGRRGVVFSLGWLQ